LNHNNHIEYDLLIESITQYLFDHEIEQTAVFDSARLSFIDAIGHGIFALRSPECTKHLGPIINGTIVPGGARVPGTSYQLDPAKCAFDISCMTSWLNIDQVCIGNEPGYPGENLGAILAVADYISMQRMSSGYAPLSMHNILTALIKTYEIQVVLGLENGLGQFGLAQSLFSKVASTAVVTQLLGGDRSRVKAAISLAFLDAPQLKCERVSYPARAAFNAGLNSSRAVTLSFMAVAGENGIPDALAQTDVGFHALALRGKTLKLLRKFEALSFDNIVFRCGVPAHIHWLTGVEIAGQLHSQVSNRLDDIERIEVKTHRAALQGTSQAIHSEDSNFIVTFKKLIAQAIVYGQVGPESDSDIEQKATRYISICAKVAIEESAEFTQAFMAEEGHALPNSIRVYFRDGSVTADKRIDFPLGHKCRREEGEVAITAKFESNIGSRFSRLHAKDILEICENKKLFESLAVNELMDLFVV